MPSGVGVQVPPSAPTLNQKVECKQFIDAGWSSLVARRAHNPKVVGSNPAPATTFLAEPSALFDGLGSKKADHLIGLFAFGAVFSFQQFEDERSPPRLFPAVRSGAGRKALP